MSEIIEVKNVNGVLTVSSLQVAKDFGKEHKNIIQAIENIKAENSAVTHMFIEATYQTGTGKNYKCYEITKDGFCLLVMGFTGKKALDWKLEYIKAFNKMEQIIKNNFCLSAEDKCALSVLHAETSEQKLMALSEYKDVITKPLVQMIETQKPKVTYYDKILSSNELLTTTHIAKDYGYTAKEFNKILADFHIQYKRSNTWFLYKEYANCGYMKSYTGSNNEHNYTFSKWTQAGRKFLYDFLKKNGIVPTIEKKEIA